MNDKKTQGINMEEVIDALRTLIAYNCAFGNVYIYAGGYKKE